MHLDDIRLETPRLILRPTRLEDFEAWAAFMGDTETMRFMGGTQPRSMAWRAPAHKRGESAGIIPSPR